ncbi:MAG TPA: TIGR00300 family protein [Chthoniobacterales bacterium]|jgi:lysine-ketoglutarate reductase/saccharopine dehydrogenase-like protein (TIGR00300 family)|nr:TIGR00300 family protein [Chthoniobacterales bacterium]
MFSETVILRGHIIDSLILPKVLDQILTQGGEFKIAEIKIGQNRVDQSFAQIDVSAPTHEKLDDIVLRLRQHGAEVIEKADVQLAPAPADGVFPNEFYVTTNQRTLITLNGAEIEVHPALMDCVVVVDRETGRATAKKFHEIRRGMEIVIGHQGIKVVPVQRSTARTDVFEFMSTNISLEKPKSGIIREMATELQRARTEGGKILVVAGPALVHSGAVPHLEKLIEWGYVDLLFAGNALALHDIENALFGTSLGINLEKGSLAERGHENQMRALNVIREAGSISRAVETGTLKTGIMAACVRHGVEFVLAGSIRDDGPLPDVLTDTIEAQDAMREKITGVTTALMMGTMLHSMAVTNLLPATVKTLCVDVNPAAVSKLTERGSFQSVGLVSDLEPFLRELTVALAR